VDSRFTRVTLAAPMVLSLAASIGLVDLAENASNSIVVGLSFRGVAITGESSESNMNYLIPNCQLRSFFGMTLSYNGKINHWAISKR